MYDANARGVDGELSGMSKVQPMRDGQMVLMAIEEHNLPSSDRVLVNGKEQFDVFSGPRPVKAIDQN